MSTPSTTEQFEDTSRDERTIAFAKMCQAGDRAWIITETYNPVDTTWRVDMLRFVASYNKWMYQRYRYDDFSKVIFVLGERPVNDAELTTLRRTGRAIV